MTSVAWESKYGIDPTGSELCSMISDTSGVITGSGELVNNGENPTTTTGWTAGNSATLSAVGNRLRVAYNAVTNPYAYQLVTLDVAEVFLMSVVGYFSASFSVTIGTTAGASDIYDSGTKAADFTAGTSISSSATCYINLYAITAIAGFAEFNFASIRRQDLIDYSPNDLGMYVEGSLTASPVADGAELQMISGFTNTDFVESTRGMFMPGTGDFYIRMPFKQPPTASNKYIFSSGYFDGSWVGSSVAAYIISDGKMYIVLSDDGITTYDLIITDEAYDDNIRHSLSVVRSGNNVLIYIDEVLVKTAAIVFASGSLNNLESTMRIGVSQSGSGPNADGYLGSLQYGYYAPSPEQIAEWYKEESRLFKKNAALQIVGESYSMNAPHERIDKAPMFVGSGPDENRSYGGNSQAITTDEYDDYSLASSLFAGVEAKRFAAFLRSAYGELFTFDELGSVAIPYEPVTLEMTSKGRPESRVGMLPDTMKFSYKARTV